jgi:Rrf2 family protein
LVQILLQLKRSGFVESVRGASGGYRLALRPDQISLLDIVTAIDGAPQLPRSGTKNAAAVTLKGVWTRLCETERQCLSGTTFDELAAAVQSETAVMYYI